MLEINLLHCYGEQAYFTIYLNGPLIYSSGGIASFLNLNTDTYNNILIEKVIKHNDYTISNKNKDLIFKHLNAPKETYIERFKDTFANQLTLLALGGTNT